MKDKLKDKLVEEQIFLKNIIDSTLSIPLDKWINKPSENNKEIQIGDVTYNSSYLLYEYDLIAETDDPRERYRFEVRIFKIKNGVRQYMMPKLNFFGSLLYIFNKKDIYTLSIGTSSTSNTYGNSSRTYDNFNSVDYPDIKKIFDFLSKREDEKSKRDREARLKKYNQHLIKIIDKSITRDEKLDGLLK